MNSESPAVFDVNSIARPINPYSNSTLNNMRKVDLIKYIRELEHNCNIVNTLLAQQTERLANLGKTAEQMFNELGYEKEMEFLGRAIYRGKFFLRLTYTTAALNRLLQKEMKIIKNTI